MITQGTSPSGAGADAGAGIKATVSLNLTPDQLLSTTRAVRRRLDLTRPIERGVIEDCLGLAQQAPTGSLIQDWHFVIVSDPTTRSALADLWRVGAESYLAHAKSNPDPTKVRLLASVRHLRDHLHEVPVHLIPCLEGRIDGASAPVQAARWASLMPAVWSFMLAARSRGLGTVWTSFHLGQEEAAAELLGIPYGEVMQAALIPVAYTVGLDFKPGPRKPLESLAHWDHW